jgi:hypothetical protein
MSSSAPRWSTAPPCLLCALQLLHHHYTKSRSVPQHTYCTAQTFLGQRYSNFSVCVWMVIGRHCAIGAAGLGRQGERVGARPFIDAAAPVRPCDWCRPLSRHLNKMFHTVSHVPSHPPRQRYSTDGSTSMLSLRTVALPIACPGVISAPPFGPIRLASLYCVPLGSLVIPPSPFGCYCPQASINPTSHCCCCWGC